MRKRADGTLWLALTPLGIYGKLFREYRDALEGFIWLTEDERNRIANIGAVKNTPKEWRKQYEH